MWSVPRGRFQPKVWEGVLSPSGLIWNSWRLRKAGLLSFKTVLLGLKQIVIGPDAFFFFQLVPNRPDSCTACAIHLPTCMG